MQLPENATKQEIKQRYRKMAMKYHPDKYANSSEEELNKAKIKMQEINEAYTYLKNEI